MNYMINYINFFVNSVEDFRLWCDFFIFFDEYNIFLNIHYKYNNVNFSKMSYSCVKFVLKLN